MTWRVAKSLDVLLRQLNAAFPNRDKSSDGSIGDEAHASRTSDHNPYIKDGNVGVVRARDFTNDAPYMDSHKLALALIASRDKRIRYVIDHGQICSGNDGPSPWKWRKYTGENQHDHHVHVSVSESKSLYDDETPWDMSAVKSVPGDQGAPAPLPKPNRYPVLRIKSTGADVSRLQSLLNSKMPAAKLVVDGVVGVYTWKALEE